MASKFQPEWSQFRMTPSNSSFRHENRQLIKQICHSKLSCFCFLKKVVGSRKIMKIQGKLEGVIKESRIDGVPTTS